MMAICGRGLHDALPGIEHSVSTKMCGGLDNVVLAVMAFALLIRG